MKKILFLATALMLSLTTLTSQVTTTTLNTITDFSDFSIGGTVDDGAFVKTTQSPLTLLLVMLGLVKFHLIPTHQLYNLILL